MKVETPVALFDRRTREATNDVAYAFVRDDLSVSEQLSSETLGRQVRARARQIASRTSPGDRVLLVYEHGLDVVRAFWACLYAGTVPILVPSPDAVRLKHSLPRLRAIAEDARTTLTLTTSRIRDAACDLCVGPEISLANALATDLVDEEAADFEPRPRAATDLAYLQYTSGSTGAPRGVMITHANVLANCQGLSDTHHPDAASSTLSWLPHYHDYGLVYGIIWPLFAGIPGYLMSPITFVRRPLRWLEALSRFRITFTGGPNFAYASCAQAIAHATGWQADLSSVRMASCGAEPINPRTVRRFAQSFAPYGFSPQAFTPGFGMAEATLTATVKTIGASPTLLSIDGVALAAGSVVPIVEDRPEARTLVGCGVPVPGTFVAIVDPVSKSPVEDDRVGEIWLSGPSIGSGYWGKEESTREIFGQSLPGAPRRDWLRSGDLGFMHGGELFITGRLKDLLIIHGRNYYPQDIEWTAERAHPGLRVGYSAALALDGEDGEQLLVVQEVDNRMPESELEPALRAIRKAVADEHDLPVHAIALIRSGSIPRTSSGKIRRQACKQELLAGRLSVLRTDMPESSGADAPSAEVVALDLHALGTRAAREEALGRFMIESVARLTHRAVRTVSLDKSPIECGLDSLSTFQLLQQIESVLHISLAPTALLNATSLRALIGEVLDLIDPGPSTTPVVAPNAREVVPTAGASRFGALEQWPASASQEGVWVVETLAGPSALYNLGQAVRFRGPLDLPALEQGLQMLVDRHASLRTAFEEHDGTPTQVVHPAVRIALPLADLRSQPPELRDQALQQWLNEGVRQPFDLTAAPLLRTQVLRIHENEHVVLFVVHHLVFDGWSMSILARELSELYAALSTHRAISLPVPRARYADYVTWQRERLRTSRAQQQLDYWRDKLAGLDPTELRTDRPRPQRMSFRGAMERFEIPSPLLRELKKLAQQENVTLFMLLLAAFQTLLLRYTGREDVSVGSPVAGRSRAEFAPLVGFFSNTLVLRTDLSGNPTFKQLLARVRMTCLEAYANQDIPSDRLVAELGMSRDLSRNSLYPIAFALQNVPEMGLQLPGLGSASVPIHTGTSKSDLWVALTEASGELRGEIEYSTDLFDAATIGQLAHHFRRVLAGVVVAPEQPIASIQLLDERERHRLITDWNATSHEYPLDKCMHELFEERARQNPEATAVVLDDQQLTYAELERRSNQLAYRLRELGVARDGIVGICLERSPEMVIAMLATLKAGGAFLPLDPEYPLERLQFMLRDAATPVVLTQRSLRDHVAAASAQGPTTILCLDAEWGSVAGPPDTGPAIRVDPDDLAYVIYTSGSSGKPKGVLIPHRGLCNHICWIVDQLQLTAADRVLQKTSISFDASLWEIFAPLRVGGPIILAPPGEARDIARLAHTLVSARISVLLMVPSALRALLDEPLTKECSSLRYVLSGGEALERQLARDLFVCLPNVTLGNFYGPSEASDDATCCELQAAPAGAGSVPIGRPIANVRCYVLDPHGQPVPPGVAGELHVAGAGLARGYLNSPALTAERFVPDPFCPGERMYRTGDIARHLSGGELEYLGRADQQIKLRGFRVELDEIEAALKAAPRVKQSVVIARDEVFGGKRLHAYVTGDDVDIASIYEALRAHLPAYMLPTAIVPLAALPYLPNGKVDRNRLPLPDATSGNVGFVPPSGSSEERLAAIWRTVLGIERIGAHDNFFDLGGHSLLATRMMARVRAAFGTDLALRALFEAPTIAQLAERLKTFDGRPVPAAEMPPLVHRPGNDAAHLSSAQEGLWFLDRLQGPSAAYNIALAVRLTGALDVLALERSLNALIERHATLRTAFAERDGEALPIVSPQVTLHVGVTPLASSAALSEASLRRLLQECAQEPFDLERAPLVRAKLYQLAENEHVLLLVVHHLVVDGWSMGILATELTAAYSAYRAGLSVALAPLPIEFLDYVRWEHERAQSGALAPHVAYWRERLAGLEPLQLRPEQAKRKAVTSRGGSEQITLSGAQVAALKSLAHHENASLFMVVLAAFQTLLMRWSGQEDIAVGSPVAGRELTEIEGVVGNFVNTLVLRTDLSGNPSFVQLLERVRRTALDAFAHQNVPFQRLVAELSPTRNLNHNPLFDVLINYTEQPRQALALPGLEVRAVELDAPPARFAVTLYLNVREEEIDARLVYRSDLFSAARAASMLEQFASLLEQITAEPHTYIQNYSLVTRASRAVLPDPAAPLAAPPQQLVTARFLEWARTTPEQPAVTAGVTCWTYSDLATRALALAGTLQARGIARGDVVAIMGERSPALIGTMLGVMLSGGVFLTIDPALPFQRRRRMLQESRARLLCLVGVAEPETSVETLTIDHDCAARGSPKLARAAANGSSAPVIQQDDPAYIFFTSGSTGTPKAILGCHKSLSHFLRWQQQQFEIGPGDRVSQLTALSFDAMLRDVFLPLTTGATLCLPDELNAVDPLPWLQRERITVVHTTPTLLTTWLLATENAIDLSTLRWLFLSGEPLTDRLVDDWRRRYPHCRLVNLYGPTETTMVRCWYTIPAEPPVGNQPVGKAIPNSQALVLNPVGQLCGIGEPGEIVLRTPFRTLGYLNLPEENQRRFRPNPFTNDEADLVFFTGDLGQYAANGTLEIYGRADDQVKIRGVRVEPGEVTAVLASHEAIGSCIVVARKEDDASHRLIAYVVLTAGRQVGAPELRAYVAEYVPEAYVPGAFVFLEKLPLLANGKVDRRALPAPTAESATLGRSQPRSVIERALWDIWREVLRLENLGVHDNFFELGGHSLLATQVMSRIRHTLRAEIPLRALFETPTIAGLAAQITQITASPQTADPIEALPRDAPLPLSFSQQRMWFVQQLTPEGTAYNMPFAMRIRGEIDEAALRAAVNTIVARHEAFRTRFVVADGEPAQVISPSGPDAMRTIDLRHLPEPLREPEVRSVFRKEAMRPFDLSQGSLHRFLLARLGDYDYALMWLVHHAVGDHWSGGVIIRELGELYRAFHHGETPQLEPITIQYADFAAWQRQQLGGDALAGQIAYWRQKLDGLQVLALPTDHPRPPEQTFRGARLVAPISPATLSALKRLSARHGGTPFMALLACFKVLLARYCNQEDIAVGTPIANRTRIETERLVGTLVNTLVLRTSLAGDPTFNELLGRVRETALGAYAHQDLPFERLVEELIDTHDMSHAPLVQVLFNVPNTPVREVRLEGLELDIFEFDRGSAQFDLSVSVDTERFQRVNLSYATDVFDAATAERLIADYVSIIEQAVARPDACISTLSILAGAERSRVVHEWNRTATPYPADKRTDELIAAQAQRTPQAIAVSDELQRLTYAELHARTNRLTRYLLSHGIARESVVGICLERSVDMIVALLAVMKAGGTYVPLDPAFPRSRLEAVALDAGLDLCITHSDVRDALTDVECRIVCLDRVHREIEAQSAEPLERSSSPDDLAYVLYTSGSTGKPKGVEISHRALTNLLCSMRAAPGCTERDTLLAVTTLSFDIAGLELYLPLIVGGHVVLASVREASDGRRLRERMELCSPTMMQATPATWRMLIEAGWTGSERLTVLCGGEALSQDLAQQLAQSCAALWNLYGPTETTIWSMIERLRPEDSQVSIGRPIANTCVYILDRNREPVPVGVSGELWIGGHGLARGYRNLPELTAERFVPDPFSNALGARMYRTGDLARYLADGRVVHLGRLDFQVKIRGYRIEPSEIEKVLAGHPQIGHVVVAAKDDRGGLKQLVAYLIANSDSKPTPASLRALVRATLPEYMVPSQFVFLDSFPLTANRKVDVQALPAPTADLGSVAGTHAKPRGRLEVQLTVLWHQVLGNTAVGVHDNFFDAGGHSLKAVQLMSSIEQVTGRKLPLATLFQAPTVAQMAQLLMKAGWQPSWRSLVAIQPAGRKSPVFAMPGVGGNVLMFAQLSKLLGDDQPFYGLQARGLDDTSEPFDSMPEMAEHYVEEIRSVQTRGPYVVIGACTGGVIAYEVAQQLTRRGEPVVLLLLETWHPLSARPTLSMKILWPFRSVWSKVSVHAQALARVPMRAWPQFLWRKARNVGRAAVGVSTGDHAGRDSSPQYVRATWRAVSNYSPQQYPGKLLNVIAKGRKLHARTIDTRRLWETHALASETIFMTAGDSGLMFVSPHVEELAGHIKRYVAGELAQVTPPKEESARRGDLTVPIEKAAARR